MKTLDLLTPEVCREAMCRFWDDQVHLASTKDGVAMALPLMYPDGWQVRVFIESLSPSTAIISDKGQTLMRLQEQDLNYDAGLTGTLLEERKKTFELNQDGFELFREIRLPLDGLDVQLFAESLVSIAHLVYRVEPPSPTDQVIDQTLKQIFKERNLTPETHFKLDGMIEQGVRVDYYWDRGCPVACQAIRRRGNMLPYMEQWGFRWTDIHQRNPTLLRAMIYDPDKQEWDPTSLNIGKQVCELFCPYFENKLINRFLDKTSKN